MQIASDLIAEERILREIATPVNPAEVVASGITVHIAAREDGGAAEITVDCGALIGKGDDTVIDQRGRVIAEDGTPPSVE